MANAKWQTLLKSALETEDYEIDCQECHDVLDLYAELLLETGDPAEIMPTVQQHLKQCNCCTAELEAILIMLDELLAPEKDLS